MAQSLPPFCPRCGATTVARQRFCPGCGLSMAPWLPAEGEEASVDPEASFRVAKVPVPAAQGSRSLQSQLVLANQESRSVSPATTTKQSSTPVPLIPMLPSVHVPEHKIKPKRSSRRILALILLLMALLLLALGGYIGWTSFSVTTQFETVKKNLNITIPYAGIDITLMRVEHAPTFPDDPVLGKNGGLRLYVQAQNTSSESINLDYHAFVRMILPDKTMRAPLFLKAGGGLAPGAVSAGFIDFTLGPETKVEQLSLLFGSDEEEQFEIPLNGKADVKKYQPQTKPITGQLNYQGLDWKLVSVTKQFGMVGKQAKKGMHYVTITLQVDNTLVQKAIPGSAHDYARLEGRGLTLEPTHTTMPVSFDAGVKGKTGTITFLAPQGITTLTLILGLGQSGFKPSAATFEL